MLLPLCVWDGNTTHTICCDLILNTLADVIANLFSVVDGNKTTIIYQYILADVIAMVADVIATYFQFDWLMLLPLILVVCWLMVLPWW